MGLTEINQSAQIRFKSEEWDIYFRQCSIFLLQYHKFRRGSERRALTLPRLNIVVNLGTCLEGLSMLGSLLEFKPKWFRSINVIDHVSDIFCLYRHYSLFLVKSGRVCWCSQNIITNCPYAAL